MENTFKQGKHNYLFSYYCDDSVSFGEVLANTITKLNLGKTKKGKKGHQYPSPCVLLAVLHSCLFICLVKLMFSEFATVLREGAISPKPCRWINIPTGEKKNAWFWAELSLFYSTSLLKSHYKV